MKLKDIAMTGGKIVLGAVMVYSFGIAPTNSYAWRFNSRSTESKQDPNWKSRRSENDPRIGEAAKKALEKTPHYWTIKKAEEYSKKFNEFRDKRGGRATQGTGGTMDNYRRRK